MVRTDAIKNVSTFYRTFFSSTQAKNLFPHFSLFPCPITSPHPNRPAMPCYLCHTHYKTPITTWQNASPCHPHAKTAMPCHLHCQPCHAINKIAMLHPFILTAMPCQSRFCTMLCLPNAIWHVVLTCKWAPLLRQLDAITLSPAHDCDRGCARMAGHSSPSKRPRIQSLSRSRLCSQSHSPPRHHRRHYVSPNTHGRCTRLTSNSKEKGSNPPFFQLGTAGSGTSACAICLGRHKHEFEKCSATKLWNRKKMFIRRNEQGRLVFLDGLPICFNFQTMVGCQDASHPSRHICSGCGVSGHGAQRCPQTQKN